MGSATTVVNRDIKQQSVGVAVKHQAPTDACLINKQHQNKISSKRKSKKASFSLCKVLLVIYRVLWLRSLSLVAVLKVSHHLVKDKMTGRKFMKMRREKTEELQKGV